MPYELAGSPCSTSLPDCLSAQTLAVAAHPEPDADQLPEASLLSVEAALVLDVVSLAAWL